MSDRRSAYTGSDNEKLVKQVKEAASQSDVLTQTPMRLLNEVSRSFGRLVEVEAPTKHMQNSNRLILRELSIRGGLCQLDLSRLTHLKPPTISVALRKMEEDGYVVRVIDDNDMRTTRVYLTDKGIEINKKLHDRISEIDSYATEGLTAEECENLNALLLKMKSNLDVIIEKLD